LRSTLVTRARTSVAAAYARKRDFDRAIDSFSHAQEIAPTNANAYDGRGLAKSNKGDNDGAIADLNVAITLDPRSARAFNNRGFAKSRNSDIDGAIADYTEAIRLNGAYTLAYINRGRVKAKKNDLEGAIADFTQAITLEPNNAAAYFDRGRARQRRGETSAADLDFTRATTLDPKLTRPAAPPPSAGTGAGGPYRPGPGVTTPRVVHEVKPRYTVDAMTARLQGSVLLECVVAADGSVSDARVVRTLDPGLDTEAVTAARQWRFEPGTKDGTPVPVLVRLELTFTLGPATRGALALPDEFVASPGSVRTAADNKWQEQVIEGAAFRTHVAFPERLGRRDRTSGHRNWFSEPRGAVRLRDSERRPDIVGACSTLFGGSAQIAGRWCVQNDRPVCGNRRADPGR
jgi:TonB family protein